MGTVVVLHPNSSTLLVFESLGEELETQGRYSIYSRMFAPIAIWLIWIQRNFLMTTTPSRHQVRRLHSPSMVQTFQGDGASLGASGFWRHPLGWCVLRASLAPPVATPWFDDVGCRWCCGIQRSLILQLRQPPAGPNGPLSTMCNSADAD